MKKKITVLHFVHTLFGGVASVATNLILYQQSLGWNTVVVYSNFDQSFADIVGRQTSFVHFKEKKIPGIYMCLGMDVKQVYCDYKKRHQDEFVLCHVHNIQALGALGSWGQVPLVCTLHSLNGEKHSIRQNISNYLYRIALIRLFHHKKQITSVSYAIVKEYAKIRNADRIKVIHNGTKINEAKRKKQEKFVIGHVGNLSYAKGWDILLEAFSLIPDRVRANMQLLAAGNESSISFEMTKQYAYEHQFENQIKCLGYVGNAKDEVIPNLDVLVLASRNEGLGLVQVEAMGYGIPVLGRDTGGICEVLSDGYNGLVIMTAKDLAEKIQTLYENRELYRRLSNGAKSTYQERFTLKQMCQSYDKVYADAMKEDRT